jgi:hypothetical protein
VETAPDDRGKLAGQIAERGELERSRTGDPIPDEVTRTVDGWQAGDQHVRDRADRPHVGGRAELLGAPLLGRHVHRRAGRDAELRLGDIVDACTERVGGTREAEIHDARTAVGREQHVRWCEIEVNDAFAMSGGDRGGKLARDAHRLDEREACAIDPIAQRGTVDVLHDDVRAALVLADLVDRDDIGMREPRRRARLAPQITATRVRELDGDTTTEPTIDREIHHAEAAGTEPANHLELPDPQRFHRRS